MAFRRPVGIGSVFLVAFVGLAGAYLVPACLVPERPPSDSQGAPGGGGTLGEADGGPRDGGLRDGALADSGAALCAPPTFVEGVTFARNVYVASTGDDANDGLTREKPWRSLRNVSKLKPGDNVEISPGSYPCSVRLTVEGTASAPVWIHGVLNQAPPTFDCGADEFGVRMEGASYVAVENLAFRASPRDLLVVDRTQDATARASHHVLVGRTVLSEFGGAALRVVGASDVDVRESTFRGPAALGGGTDRGGVVTLGAKSVLILANRFDEFGAVPGVVARAGSSNVMVDANRFAGVGTVMSLGGTSSPVDFVRDTDDFEGANLAFLNNLVTGAVDDVFLLAGCVDCFIVNNTISARGASSLVRSFRGAVGTARGAGFSLSKGLSVYNNIVEFLSVPVRMFNVATEDSVGLRLSHSLLRAVGTTVSAVASAPPAAGERIVLDVDPRFVAPQAGDYRLQTGSPAAGAGVAVSLVKRNGQGQCRTEWNMGAF